MSEFGALEPLEGGWSGETFLARTPDGEVVVRVYGEGRDAAAPARDAAVLGLVRGLLPVARVLEVRPRRGAEDLPGLLVTERLPGERVDLVLPRLDAAGLEALGAAVGEVAGVLAGVAQPRGGTFAGPDLTPGAPPPPFDGGLPDVVAAYRPYLGLSARAADRLVGLAEDAEDLLASGPARWVLCHGDLNPKNLLVTAGGAGAPVVSGVLDWEFAHADRPWVDLGNVLRFDRAPAYVAAVLAAAAPRVGPGLGVEEVLDRARAADLVALVDLAARRHQNPVGARAAALLEAVVDAGDWHAAP